MESTIDLIVEKKEWAVATKNKKVVICGTAPTVSKAPFNDPTFDIWGVAHCCFIPEVTRMDAIFELHKKHIYEKDNAPFSRFPNAVAYLQNVDEKMPNSKRFPLEEILSRYKVNAGFDYEADYQSSSIGYMICMAIESGFEEIHVYGIHLLCDEEYFFQRPSTEYYLGFARGRGIKVYVHPGADILKFSYLYGYHESDVATAKARERIEEFTKRGNALMQQKMMMSQQFNGQMQQLENQIQQLLGAKEDCVYWLRGLGVEHEKKEVIF